MLRRKRPPPADPFDALDTATLAAGYRSSVEAALRARAEFRRLVDTIGPGPVQDRLRESLRMTKTRIEI